ncbi:hypothetical protein CA13_67520 [Planctomycetes bacterium CA13]|uniref:Uncharacterized protein n=1 Tax=Novipirellula herctigrandis TaxID=2527986 RepID=A0A5C5YN93_9BACT|nr:hypothetical protein CA13_67520 [Planctomycetes bacterium CA13]
MHLGAQLGHPPICRSAEANSNLELTRIRHSVNHIALHGKRFDCRLRLLIEENLASVPIAIHGTQLRGFSLEILNAGTFSTRISATRTRIAADIVIHIAILHRCLTRFTFKRNTNFFIKPSA